MSSEYPKIETLYERDPATFKVKRGALRNPVYEVIKTWHWNEKIDGMNIRCIWDHAAGTVTFGGRTDNANLPAKLVEDEREGADIFRLDPIVVAILVLMLAFIAFVAWQITLMPPPAK